MFLFFSMLLLCSFFRLKELFQVKNGLTRSLLFFLKMPKIWVGRTTLNGEKIRRMAQINKNMQRFIDALKRIVTLIMSKSFFLSRNGLLHTDSTRRKLCTKTHLDIDRSRENFNKLQFRSLIVLSNVLVIGFLFTI